MIQTTVCCKCKTEYTCIGTTQKAYNEAVGFIQHKGHWRPVCSDKKECEIRQKTGEPAQFIWERSIRRRRDKR